MRLSGRRAARLAFSTLAAGMSMAFFAAFAHHAYRLDGILLSTVLYALLMRSGVALQSSAPWLVALWGVLFLLPHALMQIGLLIFMRALLIVAPQLFRKVGAFELRRRLALS